MTVKISGTAPSGRSPDANAIYNQYLAYYQDINNKITDLNNQIHNIDLLPYSQRTSQSAVQQRQALSNQISSLRTLQKNLTSIYQAQYNSPTATLASFNAAYQAAVAAMGGGASVQQQIQTAYTSAQNIAAALRTKITTDQANLSALMTQAASLSDAINNPTTGLLVKYNTMSDLDPFKATVKKDLDAANTALAVLNSDIQIASKELSSLDGSYDAITGSSGLLAQLQALSILSSPQATDATKANSLLSSIQQSLSDEQVLVSDIMKATTDLAGANTALQVVQADFSPSAQVQSAYQTALSIVNAMQVQIGKDQAFFNNLQGQVTALSNVISGLKTTIANLQSALDSSSLSSDQRATAEKDLSLAQQDLTAAIQAFGTLSNTTIPGAAAELDAMIAKLSEMTNSSGTGSFDQLKALATNHSTDATTAGNLLSTIQSTSGLLQTEDQTVLQPVLSSLASDISSLNTKVNTLLPGEIATVNADLTPVATMTAYDQYVNYYNAINDDINQINAKYPAPQPDAVRSAIVTLVALQQKISGVFYGNPNATLSAFKTAAQPYITQVATAFSVGMNGGLSIQQQILANYTTAQTVVAALQKQLAQDQDNLNGTANSNSLTNQALALQSQINALTTQLNDPNVPAAQRSQASQDLQIAQAALSKLTTTDIPAAQQKIALLSQALSAITAQGGALSQLQILSSRTTPALTQADLTTAGSLLNNIQQLQNNEQTYRSNEYQTATGDIAPIQTAISIVQKDIDPMLQIQAAMAQSQAAVTAMQAQNAQNVSALSNLNAQAQSLQTTIAGLQTQIASITDPAKKQQAQASLQSAQQLYDTLTKTDIPAVQQQVNALSAQIAALTGPQSPYAQLQAIGVKTNPTWDDVMTTTNLLISLDQSIKNINQTPYQTAYQTATKDVVAINTAITAAQTATPYQIEHGTWYITWVSNDMPIPQGGTTVNIFEGAISQDASGNFILSPFAGPSLSAIQAFVAKCHAANPPISVKVSIGGAGGQSVYNNTWDQITPSNVQKVGTDLANFCLANGIDGIDFDYEEFQSQQQAQLVGTLIKTFKSVNPSLQTSLDSNAGFGPNFPWQGYMQSILDAASSIDPVTGKKICAVDRFNIMCYGVYLGNIGSLTPLQAEVQWIAGSPVNNKWVTNPDGSLNWATMYPTGATGGWAQWLQTTYGFSPAQIGVGIDAYDNLSGGTPPIDVQQFAQFAHTMGYSTEYWAYDPRTNPSSSPAGGSASGSTYSNDETNAIRKVYDPGYVPPSGDVAV